MSYNDPVSEEGFRYRYDSVVEHTSRCHYGIEDGPDGECCGKLCHWLAAQEVNDDAEPPILGLDCTVDFICWGGDAEDITAEVYCLECSRKIEEANWRWQAEERKRSEEAARIWREQRDEYESQRRRTAEYWTSLNPLEFEKASAVLFESLDWLVSMTAASNDGAIDLMLEKDSDRHAVQCKYANSPSSVHQVREFYGAIMASRISHGYFLSKSGGTREAWRFVGRVQNLELWDLNKIIEVATKVHADRARKQEA